MIFDTSFVIDIMNKDVGAVKKLNEIVSRGELGVITTPTLFELYSGMARSTKQEAEKQKILYTISQLLVWHLEPRGAEKGGEIDGKLITEGQKIDPIDSMIAGIAMANGEKLLTRNVKHFSKIAGLKVETY